MIWFWGWGWVGWLGLVLAWWLGFRLGGGWLWVGVDLLIWIGLVWVTFCLGLFGVGGLGCLFTVCLFGCFGGLLLVGELVCCLLGCYSFAGFDVFVVFWVGCLSF